MNSSESNKQVAGSHTPWPWRIDEHRNIKTGNSETLLLGGVSTPMVLGEDMREGWANARRIVACVNACDGISTEYLETTGLPEFAGKTLCTDMVQVELDAMTKQRDGFATKAADLELALFAENQKRQDVEQERDRLKALSVEHILLRVVPGYDGMGEEVYAKSVADVEKLLSKTFERLDTMELQRDQLLAALEEVIRISDRKHDAWDNAKAAIAAVKGGV